MSELAELKRMGARPVKNSGRGQLEKGDGRLDIFTVDVKEYPKGFTINQTNWAKICHDARRNDYSQPMLAVVLGEENSKTRLAVVEMGIIQDYIRLREEESLRELDADY